MGGGGGDDNGGGDEELQRTILQPEWCIQAKLHKLQSAILLLRALHSS